MAQGSKPRHSRSTRKPVTIDLEPDAVSEEGKGEKKAAAEAKASAGTKAAAAKATTRSTPKTGPVKKAQAKAADEKADPVVADEKATESAKVSKEPPVAGTAKADKPAATAEKSEPAGKPAPGAIPGVSAGAADSQPSSGSGMRMVAAGLVGGVIALLLLIGLQWGGVVPTPGAADGETGSVTGVLSADVAALKRTVAALESDADRSGSDSIGQALQERVEALEQSVDLSASGASSTLSALETQVSGLAARVEALGASGGEGDTSELAGKLTALETAQSGQQSDLTQIQSSISDLVTRIGTDEQTQDETIKGLEDRLASIEQTLSSPREDIRVAQALAAANLKAAIDRGGSFMAELEAFASVDKDSPAISQLNTLAASGVPSRAMLLNEFPTVATNIINASKGRSDDSGWVDRLMNSASSLVQVRPVGDVSGDSVEAIVARMETKLNNGDLQGAVDEWKTLPEASQDVSKSYADDLEARILVEKLVSGTVNAALPTETSTGGSAAPQQTQTQQSDNQQTQTQQSGTPQTQTEQTNTQQTGGTN